MQIQKFITTPDIPGTNESFKINLTVENGSALSLPGPTKLHIYDITEGISLSPKDGITLSALPAGGTLDIPLDAKVTKAGSHNFQVLFEGNATDPKIQVYFGMINVRNNASKPPVADLKVYNADTKIAITEGYSPLGVLLVGDGSYDPDGTITAYGWDINDDGAIEIKSKNTNYIFTNDTTSDKIYRIRFIVTDDALKTTISTTSITVHPNQKPVAAFTISPISPQSRIVGANLTFDASASNDRETSSASLLYQWDFDGDGVYDTTPSSSNRTKTYAFTTVGEKSVRLLVQDPQGNTDYFSQKFTVYEAIVKLLRFDKDPNIAGQYWFYATTFNAPDIQEVQFFIDSSNAMNMIDMGGGMWRIPIKITNYSEGTHTAKVKAVDTQLNFIGEHTMQFTRTGDTITEGGSQIIQGITFVSIPSGTFQMGQTGVATPVHSVIVTGFEMGVYEITNAQYAKFLNDAKATGDITPSSTSVKGAKGAYSGQEYIYLSDTFSGYPDARCWITYNNDTFSVVSGHENWPVVWVTWYGSKAFALYYGLDLPTEAEWEYACRGGRQYEYGTDDGTLSKEKANYWDNGPRKPVVVGSYPKNPYGLCDMSGNVWEWCHDWYGTYASGSVNNPSGAQTGSYRVNRGGSWGYYDDFCRSADRNYGNPLSRVYYIGFRVVRRASPQNY
ncbi:MAG: SUMF1/EgtB/PvdO family nonheme iron enzyme [Candidatus Latescibacter sp.]|nr:SUMF1/EgtB/PvdO family nonheme iron enzyme [Candidatus Latescibacter sp.]